MDKYTDEKTERITECGSFRWILKKWNGKVKGMVCEMEPVYKKVLIGLAAVTLAAVLVCVGVYAKKQAHLKAEAAAFEQRKQEVEAHQDTSYGNKKLGQTDLSKKSALEITDLLQKELAEYQKRKVTLTVNEKEHTYSMKKLKESYYYLGSDGRKYKPSQAEKLAEYIVSMDKDLDMEQQHDILSGEQPATEYTVSIQTKWNKKRVTKVIGKLEAAYDIPVKNSHILKSGKISGTAPGRVLKTDTMKKELKKYLNEPSKEDYTASYETEFVEPTWFPKDLKKVNTVLSTFSTTFVSYSSRGHNIQVGASRINGICLLPGEKASFDQIIHDNSDGQHFQAAGSYLNGKTVQTEGGGICQISTTAYNALLRAGITPSKRYPHSMPVHYVPLGLDAAISAGVKDLEVTNNMDVPIVIRMFTKGNTLTARVVSYKGAMKGYTYKPRAVQLSSSSAKGYLDTYKNGKLVNSKLLHTDHYTLP